MLAQFIFTQLCINGNDNKISITALERDVPTSVITASRHNTFHPTVYSGILLGNYNQVYSNIKHYD
jgi:hypothetical protein